jgi:hypothetical protein
MKQSNYFYSGLIVVSFFIVVITTFFIHDGSLLDYYAGDVVSIITLYSFIRLCTGYQKRYVLIGVLWLVTVLEFLQIFHGTLLNSVLITKIFGSVFDVRDLIAYLCGGILVWIIEYIYTKFFVITT